MISKKHYTAIADVFARQSKTPTTFPDLARQYHTAVLAHELADVFAKESAKFDRDKFLAACKVETEL